MKKLLKIVALGFLFLIVAGGATIAMLARKPAPEAICNNLYDLSLAEMNKAATEALGQNGTDFHPMTRQDVEVQMKMTFDECVEDVQRRWSMSTRPGMVVAKEARCQAAAKSLEEMDDC